MARNKAFNIYKKLKEARNLFWKKGYNATSMQDLVDTVKLSRASIYDTYGDKHALFLQCLENYATEMLNEYIRVGLEGDSPFKAVEYIIMYAVDKVFLEKKSCMVVKASFELAEADKSVLASLKKQNMLLHNVLKTFLERAQEAGEIPVTKNPELLARFIISNFAGFGQIYLVTKDKKLINDMAAYLIDCIRH